MLEPWVFGNAWMPDTQEIGGEAGSRKPQSTGSFRTYAQARNIRVKKNVGWDNAGYLLLKHMGSCAQA